MAGSFTHSDYEGRASTDRIMHPSSTLGFHSPDIEIGSGSYTEGQLRQSFRVGLDTLGLIIRRRSEGRYIFPETLFLNLLETPSTNMYYITTVREVSRLDIAIAPAVIYEADVKSAIIHIYETVGSQNNDYLLHTYSDRFF